MLNNNHGKIVVGILFAITFYIMVVHGFLEDLVTGNLGPDQP